MPTTFDAFIHAQAPRATLERVPMLRGRIVEANGVPAEELKPSQSAAWVLQSDRGITFTDEVPAGSRVVEGQWWQPNEQGPPLVSFEKKVADGLGLKIGDPVTVNVLGRNITARVANLRTLDWQSLGINFVMVFSPATFRGAPATDIATLTYPGGSTTDEETALLKAAADSLPFDHDRAGARSARHDRRAGYQPGACDPRCQRPHFIDGGAGAGRRARSRAPAPGL